MSPPSDDAVINQTLGALMEDMKHLTSEVHSIRADLLRSQDKSDDSRAEMHRRMDDIVETVGEVKTDVAKAKDDIATMKPVTEDVRKWKLMGIGALGVVGLGGAALGVTLAGLLQKLLHLLNSP